MIDFLLQLALCSKRLFVVVCSLVLLGFILKFSSVKSFILALSRGGSSGEKDGPAIERILLLARVPHS